MTVPGSQHAARPRPTGRLWAAVAFALALVGTAATAIALAAPDTPPSAPAASDPPPPLPEGATALPPPTVTAVPAAASICGLPDVLAGLAAGDDGAVIAASGGAFAFRQAIAAGSAPCIPLADPAHVWVVVNKQRPCDPIDFSPSGLGLPAGVRNLGDTELRVDAGADLAQLLAASATAGAGEVGLDSGFRSFSMQRSTYNAQVRARGVAGADLISARPGFSEHQTGLAADVVACAGGCGSIEEFAATAQGAWIAAHAWEHGWIVRYEDGQTPVTGYQPEPWHLRYVGRELARAYHDGGFRTLEEFFGLPAAPGYAP
ncbi:MAG TPA: M15 family metallopeptidase [Microbacterium sp.]|uniref:M15 family metallopeptidase n=1 Tax=Microbacterium sp. TaxID=51671 RepID=UPI002CE2A4D3|nr:M15 family metallopeptidase [Microbacterium sp.]HWI30292.1 M15 family metallopeptidase [Microbacterium sp.]